MLIIFVDVIILSETNSAVQLRRLYTEFLDQFLCKHLHRSELILDGSFDLKAISQKYIPFLSKDRENELIIVFEAIGEVFERHDRVLHFFSEEGLLKEIIELNLIEIPDNEYIDDIICCHIAEIQNCLRDGHEIEIFASFEEFLYGYEYIVRLQKHLDNLSIDWTIMIHHIILLLILFIGLEDSECFEVHELSSNCIDLLIRISTEFTNKKPYARSGDCVFDDEFFEKFDTRTRAKKFDEIHDFLYGERILEPEYMGKGMKCKENNSPLIYSVSKQHSN